MTERKNNEPLDPKLDVVFKALFGKADNSDLLISLLNGLLELNGPDEITSIQMLTPVPDLDALDQKSVVMDLFVSDGRGRRYGVEMQCQNHAAFPERMLYYAARRYVEQLKRSELYSTLKPLVLVVLADFELFEDLENWKERFELRGREGGGLFTNHLSVVLVELPKFRKTIAEATDLGEKWAIFLKEGTRMKTQVMDEAWVTPELKKAIAELERLEGDERLREEYEARLDQVRVMATMLHDSFEQGSGQGLEKGIEQGIAQAKRDLAVQLLREGESLERVSRLTGIGLDELRPLARS